MTGEKSLENILSKTSIRNLLPEEINKLNQLIKENDKSIEEELGKKTKQNFFELFNANPCAIMVTDLTSNTVTEINPSFEKITKYSSLDIVGKTTDEINELLKPKHEGELKDLVLVKGDRLNVEVEFITKTGNLIMGSYNTKLIKINNKPFSITNIHDHTESKQLEISLNESVKKYKKLFDESPTPMFKTDLEGTILDFNEAAIKLIRYDIEDINEDTGIKTFYYNLNQKKEVMKILAKDGIIEKYHVLVQQKDGTIRDGLLSAKFEEEKFVNEKNEKKIRRIIFGTIEDITDLKRNEREQKKLSKFKDSLLRNFSHEIRTPLNGVLGFSQIIQENLEDEDLPLFVKKLQYSSERLLKIVSNIMLVSELESGTYSLRNSSNIDLNDELSLLVDAYKQKAEDKGLNLKYQQPNSQVIYEGDKNAIINSLNGIINNAVKFTQKGDINISLLKRKNDAIITIEDTGIGMSQEFQKNYLFNIFSKEHEGDNPGNEGSGMDLAIAKKLFDFNNIHINYKSEKHEGTKFTIEFQNIKVKN